MSRCVASLGDRDERRGETDGGDVGGSSNIDKDGDDGVEDQIFGILDLSKVDGKGLERLGGLDHARSERSVRFDDLIAKPSQ